MARQESIWQTIGAGGFKGVGRSWRVHLNGLKGMEHPQRAHLCGPKGMGHLGGQTFIHQKG